MNRRQLLHTTAALTAGAIVQPLAARAQAIASSNPSTTRPTSAAAAAVPDDVQWHDVREWGVEGRGFQDTRSYFDRLPQRAQGVVRPVVWELSRDSSGMSAHFIADTPAIYVRYQVLKPRLAMPHMPATGVSGLDLYAQHDQRWRWLATHKPDQPAATVAMQERIAPGQRGYHINLPLYNGVTRLEIGVPKGASFEPVRPRADKPILFYGTSITQGGCASRPGMAFPNILGRRLGKPILNFGFSGNGKMELEVGKFLAELDPAVFIIDCSANTPAEQITERAQALVKLWRNGHPNAPILLLDQRRWASEPLVPHLLESDRAKSKALHQAFEQLQQAGVADLHYRTGDDLIGDDGEATVDGSHPTDLGMVRYADALEPDLRSILTRG